jgi:hypothetical protein
VPHNDEPETRRVRPDQVAHVPDFTGDVAEMAPHYYGVEYR